MTTFRKRPRDDYTNAPGEPLEWVLPDELEKPEVLQAFVRLITVKMFEMNLIDRHEVVEALDKGMRFDHLEWESVD